MNVLDRNRQHFWRNLATRLTAIFITVVLIVWSLPRNEEVRLRYDIGKPWSYGSLIAKFGNGSPGSGAAAAEPDLLGGADRFGSGGRGSRLRGRGPPEAAGAGGGRGSTQA